MANVIQSHANPNPLIEVRELSVSIAGQNIHDDLSLQVESGEIVAIAGDNGSGKTSLLRAMLGGVTDAGSIRVLGEQPPLSAASLAGLGALIGEPALLPWMKPVSFLQMLIDTAGEADNGRSRKALERVAFPESRYGTRIRKLSQGEQQLIGIGAAIVRTPRLVVLDEPFSHLDRRHVDVVSAVIEDTRSQGGGVLFTSHRRSEVELADRLLVLSGGQLRPVGPDSEAAHAVLR